MAHSLSSKKRMRQNTKRQALNKARKTSLKTALRKVSDSLAHGTAEDAAASFKRATKALDRAANTGTLHRNAAARRKSRLAKKVNALQAGAGKTS